MSREINRGDFMIEERKNRAGCPKTKIGFRQNATCSGMRKREAPEVACGKEKCRVFGQPEGGVRWS